LWFTLLTYLNPSQLIEEHSQKVKMAVRAQEPMAPLHERWQFPSDHLPIGVAVRHKGEVVLRVLSWNILNTSFLHHLHRDEQGLLGSLLTGHASDPSTRDPTTGLTAREAATVDLIDRILRQQQQQQDQAPVAICLQECGMAVLQALRRRQQGETLMTSSSTPIKDQEAVLVGTGNGAVKVLSYSAMRYPYESHKSLVDTRLVLPGCGLKVRLVATHAPYSGYGREVLMNYWTDELLPALDSGQAHLALVMGDMNEESRLMVDEVAEVSPRIHVRPPPYMTHVDTRRLPVDFDYPIIAFASSSEPHISVDVMAHQEVLTYPALQEAVALLNPSF
jgi:endonuclease/exonuclease/phosphatase family metal-dependent hydrolase